MKIVVIEASPGSSRTAVSLNQTVSLRTGTTSLKYIAGGSVKSILSDGTVLLVTVAFPDATNTTAVVLELATMLRTGTSSANYKWLLGGVVKAVGVTSNY